MNCRLVHRKIEGFFAKCIETDVDPEMSHGCSKCYSDSRIEWVLTDPDNGRCLWAGGEEKEKIFYTFALNCESVAFQIQQF